MTAPGNLPVVDWGRVRPSGVAPAEPRWGHADSLQIGPAPLPSPRGLICTVAPYFGHPRERLVRAGDGATESAVAGR